MPKIEGRKDTSRKYLFLISTFYDIFKELFYLKFSFIYPYKNGFVIAELILAK